LLDLSKWNLRFITENIPQVRKQKQPTISKDVLNAIIKNTSVNVRSRVFLALLACTGMRRGELLALQIGPDPSDANSVWDSDARMIRVRKSVWRSTLQDPKTAAAVRDIDLSTPTNQMLQEFAKGKEQGTFLFCTKSGKHSNGSDITDRYSKLSENLELRRAWAERVGTGLDLSRATGHPGCPKLRHAGGHLS